MENSFELSFLNFQMAASPSLWKLSDKRFQYRMTPTHRNTIPVIRDIKKIEKEIFAMYGSKIIPLECEFLQLLDIY